MVSKGSRPVASECANFVGGTSRFLPAANFGEAAYGEVRLIGFLGSSVLARIIHERSGRLRFARSKIDEYARRTAYIGQIGPTARNRVAPYSSTKLGFVNNPG